MPLLCHHSIVCSSSRYNFLCFALSFLFFHLILLVGPIFLRSVLSSLLPSPPSLFVCAFSLRVITRIQPLSSDKSYALRNARMDILSHNATHQAARIALKGDYKAARIEQVAWCKVCKVGQIKNCDVFSIILLYEIRSNHDSFCSTSFSSSFFASQLKQTQFRTLILPLFSLFVPFLTLFVSGLFLSLLGHD